MIALGSDQGGFEVKQEIIAYLEKNQIAYKDFGSYDTKSVDYPVYAKLVAKAVQSGECEKGILVCGTGIGISIAANKVPGVRCALCSEPHSAHMTREHNNANVLAMGGGLIGENMAYKIVDEFLNTEFSVEEKHHRRVNQLEEL